MITVERQALVPYSARGMYALVDAVERYPEFLPWCSATELLLRDQNKTSATIHVDFRGVHQQFTTANENVPGERIEIGLVSGPFRSFHGEWRFVQLGDEGCKVEFKLAYQLANPVLDRLAGPIFDHIANTLVDAFVRRAEALYSK
jgi:ribosome-associated toxin RatA of RatAB toxin-antitoxin module